MSLLDPNGDLCLQVGESPVTSFVVCSKTLARTSDFWNKLLNGEFRESGKHRSQDIGSNWTVEFPEDDPRSMELLLNIIHGRFDKVPSYESVMDIQYLYNVSVLTDKYAMTHVLRPWAPGWLRRSMSFLGEWSGLSLREQYCHEWLWISWEFGDTANFEKVANFLLLNSCAWPEHPNNLRCDGVLEPPDIYEILEETRLATIEALLTPLNKIVRGLIRKDGGLSRDGSDVATTVIGTLACKVYYQDTEDVIHELTCSNDSGWQDTSTNFTAKPGSPLASVSFNSGNEVHVYIVSAEGYLEERVYSSEQDGWSPGTLDNSRFRVAEASRLAAVSWPEDSSIRLYAQNPDDTIQEYQYEASTGWKNPVVLPSAEFGSSLAAMFWEDNGHHIRVYYIDPDSTVKEQRYDPKEGWRAGVPIVRTSSSFASIAAVAWFDSSAHQRVYLHDSSGNITEYEWNTANNEWTSKGPVIGPLTFGRHIAALEWKTGTELRVFYQDDDNTIREQAKSDEGEWYPGELVA
ncbi:hypothetical protein GQX73_g7044 [Xylaria multiplex]|uniref:Uncharacterized protein n=1 Tax=Xylaria multiplex TaxID=323545 RepID=A0A7C8IQI2_9PEZI|nr:hypothetical protein GQX73_g7044 [Xylaria multiplex]